MNPFSEGRNHVIESTFRPESVSVFRVVGTQSVFVSERLQRIDQHFALHSSTIVAVIMVLQWDSPLTLSTPHIYILVTLLRFRSALALLR